jgi:predicted Fe-S protein YdhL (DUF1289 family)
MTDTFDERVQHAAEDHLNACLEALDAYDANVQVNNPAYGPFCGCNTCVVREILSVTWDLMEAEARRRVLAEMKQEQHRRIEQFGPRSDNASLPPVECPDCPPGLARIDCPGHPHPTEIEDLSDADD